MNLKFLKMFYAIKFVKENSSILSRIRFVSNAPLIGCRRIL